MPLDLHLSFWSPFGLWYPGLGVSFGALGRFGSLWASLCCLFGFRFIPLGLLLARGGSNLSIPIGCEEWSPPHREGMQPGMRGAELGQMPVAACLFLWPKFPNDLTCESPSLAIQSYKHHFADENHSKGECTAFVSELCCVSPICIAASATMPLSHKNWALSQYTASSRNWGAGCATMLFLLLRVPFWAFLAKLKLAIAVPFFSKAFDVFTKPGQSTCLCRFSPKALISLPVRVAGSCPFWF